MGDWACIERGWWMNEKTGDTITLETARSAPVGQSRGWYVWRADRSTGAPAEGPYRTRDDAIDAAESR